MSKGGSTTSNTEIPAWLENAGIENINKARDVSQIGYVPYYGPDVAAFSPMQQQSMQSTGNAASAFGLAPQGFDAMAGMPEAQTFAGGVQGYSSAPLYEQALEQLQANRPAQYQAMTNMFIDPFTGAPAAGNYTATPTQANQMTSRAPQAQPDYSININNSAAGGVGGNGGGSAYDAIYHQAGSGDMTSGDTFTGDNGNTYTVGYGEGEVDHGLANAAVNNNGLNGLMSNSDAAAGIAGNLLDSSIYGKIYEGITGNPLAGGSPNAPVSDLINADVADSRFGGITGYQDYNPNIGGGLLSNTGGGSDLASDYGSDYGTYDNWGFSEAATPATQVETVAAPDTNFPTGVTEDLSLGAKTTPYSTAPVVNPPQGLIDTKVDEDANAARIAKARAADMAKDAADAKARAKKIADDKAAYQASQDDAAKDAKEKAIAAIERQIAEEDAFKKAQAAKAAKARAKKMADDKAAKAAYQAKVAADALAAKKAAAKKKADNRGPDTWSPPKNNGYNSKGRKGYRFGL